MKIMMIITGLYPGGAEKIVLETVRCLLEKGEIPLVVSLLKEPSEPENTIVCKLRSLGISPYFLNISHKDPGGFFRLIDIIRKEKPDILHAHLIHAGLAARFARLFNPRIPLICTTHIAERRNGLSQKILFSLDHLTGFLCDCRTAVSKAAAEFHEKKCRLKKDSIRVIYNGSDPVIPASPQTICKFQEENHLQDVTKIIGSIGRLDPQKGYDIFLHSLPALARLIPEKQRWGVVLIGDGPEKTKLQKIATEMMQQFPSLHIVLPGYRPDAACLMTMFDLFVMPSRYEGYGLAFTEAVSLGLPCLCSNADSLPELCRLVPENTVTSDFSPEMDYSFILNKKRSEGKIIQTTSGMTDEYLALYREFIPPAK